MMVVRFGNGVLELGDGWSIGGGWGSCWAQSCDGCSL